MLLPQELLDAILCEVEDVVVLKSCSLVAPVLRYPCQRILLRSLTLKSWSPSNYGAASTMLAEAPHVASYITRLVICRPWTNTDTEHLLRILAKLDNVHRCIIDGCTEGFCWDSFPPNLIASLLHFLARQPLDELYISSIQEIPLVVFLQLLSAAPMTSYSAVSLNRDLDDFQADIRSTSTPKALFIEFELFGAPISEILALSQLAAYLEDVRRLGIMPHWARSQHLLSPTAPTLQQLRLDCVSDCRTLSLFAESPPIQLPTVNNITIPSLPALNSAEFIIMQHDQSAPWLADALSTLLALHGSPSLGEVVITIDAESHPDPTASFVNAQLGAVLDTLLAAHPAGPRIRWRLPDKYALCSACLVSLQAGMPRAHMRHRLSMQPYVKRSKYVFDAPRKRVFDDWVVDWGTAGRSCHIQVFPTSDFLWPPWLGESG